MDLREAAEALGVHYQTAYAWARDGTLPARKAGRSYEVSNAGVQALARISAQDVRRNCVVWPRRLLAGVGGCELPEQSGRVVTATTGIA